MAKPRMDLSAFVGKLLEEQDGDVLREGIRVLSQALMETEVAGLIGAERHERTGERTAYRNGSRMRTWDTRMGTIELAIPKVRPGTYFPSLLQPRRRAEHALLAVVQEAYVHGVSTRKVDDLMKALGLDGISKSEVSRICGELDTVVAAFRTRPLTGEHRYLWVDATYHKVRVDGRVISQATVVAVGVTTRGRPPGARHRRRAVGGPRLLDRVSAQPGETRPEGRAPGHLRCPRGPEAGDQHRAVRQHVAALPRALHAQPAGDGAAGRPRGDRGDRPHHLRAARSRLRDDATPEGRRRPAHALPACRRPCSKRPPKTSSRTGICRSSTNANCTARTRSNV